MKRLLNFCALLVMSTLLVTACTPAAQRPSAPPVSTPPVTVTTPATAAPLTTPTATPAPTREPLATPGSGTASGGLPVTLASFDMIDALNGWATGTITDPATIDVLSTTDGGSTWQIVSPPVALSPANTSSYFLDGAHAWIAVSSPISTTDGTVTTTVTVFHTADGGQSWDSGVPVTIDGAGPGRMDFVDTQQGWMLASLGVAAGSEAVEIFTTVDGGNNWDQISMTSPASGESSPGSLPLVCDKTGMSFLNDSTGWAGGSCAGGALFFYVTQDGGQTWQPANLPPPPGFPSTIFQSCQCSVTPPHFTSQLTGSFAVQIFESRQAAVLYATTDGGVTWTAQALPVAQTRGDPQFVDASTGWVTDGVNLYVTHDGGATWQPLPSLPVPVGDLIDGPLFVDKQTGFLRGSDSLQVTHDGGQSWSSLTPQVAPDQVGPQGTGTPASSEVSPTVTLDDDGQTIDLRPGERFVLKLGETYNWTVTVDDPTVVSRVVNIATVVGAQGVYEAHQAGTTTLKAVGDPVCRQNKPPCAMPSRLFTLIVVVQ